LLAVLVHGAVDGWYGTATRSFTPSGLAQFSLYAALAALAVAAALVGGLRPHASRRREPERWGAR